MGDNEQVPQVRVRTHGVRPEFRIDRGSNVPDVFWLKLQAEWGTAGSNPSRRVIVPVEHALSRLAWVGPACRAYRVGIDWDERSKQLLQAHRQERELLAESRRNGRLLGPDDIGARLNGSRFQRALTWFQLRDLGRLLTLSHGADFSVPGAGKTAVAFAAYEAERQSGRVGRLLVVAPTAAFESWESEAALCFSEPPVIRRFVGESIPHDAEVLLVNYHRLYLSYEDVANWVATVPTHVILDEAHRMKRGRAGQWGTACLDLAYLAVRRDILTGTPAPQSLDDLQALYSFLWPNQARRILLAARDGRTANAALSVADNIRPLFVRTTKRELDLPPVTFSALQLEMGPVQAAIYSALRDRYSGMFSVDRYERLDFLRLGQVLMYLLEAATNPALLVAGSSRNDAITFRHPPLEIPRDSPLSALLREYQEYETPSKFIQLGRLVAQNAEMERKTVIWSTFVRNITSLERFLARYRPVAIHGGIPSSLTDSREPGTREGELERFREDSSCSVLIANPAVIGEGVSLHRVAHDAIYLDRSFNAGQYLQSVDRIHRLGLDPGQETRVTLLLTLNTIDAIVDMRLRQKTTNLAQILDDADVVTLSLPDEEDYGPALETREDALALLAHLRGDDSSRSEDPASPE